MIPRLQYLTLGHLGLSLLAIARAQGASWWVFVPCLALLVFTTIRPSPDSLTRLRKTKFRSVSIVVLVLGTVARIMNSGELIIPGVDLLLFLVMERCLFRDQLREQLQLLLLSSVLLIIAGVLHVGPDYPLLVAGFVMVTMTHLAFWNLEREAERLGDRARFALSTQFDSIRSQLIHHNLRLGLGVLGCALVVFLFFPRIGAGVFFRGERQAQAQAGFSDQVSLGHRGDIADNPRVVARIYPENPPVGQASTLPLYFRASAFDQYKQGHWSHSPSAHQTPLRASMHRYTFSRRSPHEERFDYLVNRGGPGLEFNRIPGWERSVQVSSLRVLQEDLGTEHLLVPSQPVLVQWLPRGALEQRVRLESARDEQIKTRGLSSGSKQFRVYARLSAPTTEELRAIGRPLYPQEFAPYLALPSSLSPAFEKYAEQFEETSPSEGVSQQEVLASILAALAKLRYTTRHQEPSPRFAQRDPVEAFLLDTQAGHCEYFATALALLARSQGIPARVVNGYYGAHKNPVDGTFQIAQSQAHAWVEVYFEGLGWVTLDATPTQDRPSAPARTSLRDQLRSLYQALETKYLEYVVDYDGKKQWKALKGLRDSGKSVSQQQLGIALALLAGATLLGILWRGRPRSRDTSTRIRSAQHRLREALIQQNLSIPEQENAMAWAERAAQAGLDPEGELVALVKRSEAMRFASESIEPQALKQLLSRFKQVTATLRQ